VVTYISPPIPDRIGGEMPARTDARPRWQWLTVLG